MSFRCQFLSIYTNQKRIDALYSSGDPAQVNIFQRELQALQKSPDGYNLASYLLQQHSKNCQYFGALTYAVVIQNLHHLEDERLHEIVSTIHAHIRQLTLDPSQLLGNLFIVKKLMSNLSLLYVKYHKQFKNPVWLFMEIFGAQSHGSHQDFASCISSLPPTQFVLLLVFFSIIIEDILKLNDYNSAIHVAVHDNLVPLLVVVFEYLLYLRENHQLLEEMDSQALLTLNSWMMYIPNTNGDSRYDYDQIASFIRFLFSHFQNSVDPNNLVQLSVSRQCLLIFNEILELNPSILSLELKLALYAILFDTNQWGTHFMNNVLFTDRMEQYSEEVNSFVDLVLTVLQLNSIRLSKSILEETTQNILSIAHRLSAIPGVPFVDENVSERLLVFWEDFAIVYHDSSDIFVTIFEANPDPAFRERFDAERNRIFDEIARVHWKKLHIPELSTYKAIRADFVSYRSSIAELFLVIYSLLNAPFYKMMTESLILSIQQFPSNYQLIADIEATLYLLFKINEDTVYFESQANALAPFSLQIFQSGIISTFKQLPPDDEANQLFYSTFVQYLSSNEFFFKTPEGSVFLGEVFDLLFPIIMNGSKNLSLFASKTATKICEECSKNLLGFLPNLEVIVVEMLENPSIDSLIRLRMFNAYSVIARRIKDPQEHSRIVFQLVLSVQEAGTAMMEAAGPSLTEVQEEYLISLLSCLVNIGKGSALPDDIIDEMLTQEEQAHMKFWKEDPLGVKQLVYSIVEKFSLEYNPLSQKTLVIEKCTLVLRCGLGERLGGPFEFSNETITRYLIALMDVTTNPNAVPYIYSLIETLIGINFREMDPQLVHQLITRVFTERLEFLKTDPDMIKSAINVFSKIIECKPSLIVHSEIFTGPIVAFALDGLNANELFIVKSALKFWSNLLNLKNGTKENQDKVTELFVSHNLGKLVTSNSLRSFFKAPRSNLEYYYMIFRGVLGKFPLQSKTWVIQSLNEDPQINRTKITDKDLELFVHKLMITRGRRTANEVLKAFWLTVNGFVEYNSQTF